MDLKKEDLSDGWRADVNVEKLQRTAADLLLPARFLLAFLARSLAFLTNLLARILGGDRVRRHFHLVLSGVVLFGPVLSLWASKYSIFANSNNYLYRKFLRSTWGWTCVLTSSFILLLSLSARLPLPLCLRHLSRMGICWLLWWLCRHILTLLEDAAGTCYEAVAPGAHQDPQNPPSPAGQMLLLLHEGQTKASCLRARMQWRGYEVSQDVLLLCLCCLLLVEELSVFGPRLALAKKPPPGVPLRLVFLLCVALLALWTSLLVCLLTHFPAFPAQQLGGALGYLGWRGLYQGWYRLRPGWGCPGLPGEGLLTSTTDQDKQGQ